ncbi:lysophospholipid acyltransferase family protein [Streptomyces hilarionis]|uniref:lysophospholipid acyltransferase family protein n=1 Tax=Streptomyces hilarionis TaxID=2839954 RepID=UPI00211A08AB|nr:lysophospholipid acyltransferase family protein [Streptomyces hilarionis]MCQ9135435.1 1-acyl-sn-glycerol-3-phosphate acyltransferase [Streptomyces hilarionis]
MSVWLPAAPCTPRACVPATESLAGLPRAVLRLTTVVALVLVGVLLTPLGRWIPARAVGCWSRAVVRAAGVRIRRTGAPAPTATGLLLVANHVSWLDIPLLAGVRPARMLAKAEIRRWPVAGALAARGGVLFIDRDRLRALPGTVARIADVLRAGRAVAVFPEGSTWCGRAQGRFRRAVFQAALDAGAPVQPVRVAYRDRGGAASTVPAFVGDDPLLASVWRVVRARGLVAEVEVLSVLAPGGHPDRRALAAAAEDAVLRGPDEQRVPARVGGHIAGSGPAGDSLGTGGRSPRRPSGSRQVLPAVGGRAVAPAARRGTPVPLPVRAPGMTGPTAGREHELHPTSGTPGRVRATGR